MKKSRDSRGSRDHVVRGFNHDCHESRLPRFFIFLIRLYQLCLSPWLGTCCRFEPSCSHYAQEAIARHGAAKGGWLALKRLLRCRPLARHGYDPVPQ